MYELFVPLYPFAACLLLFRSHSSQFDQYVCAEHKLFDSSVYVCAPGPLFDSSRATCLWNILWILLGRTLPFDPGGWCSQLHSAPSVIHVWLVTVVTSDQSLSGYLGHPNTGHHVTFISLSKVFRFVRVAGC